MKTLTLRSFLLLSILALSCLPSFAQNTYHESQSQEGWQHVRDEDGIDLYSKNGANGTRVYKAVATLNAFLPEITAQLMEVEDYDQWMHNFSAIEVMGSDRDGSKNLYIQINTPSFTANRDIAVNVVFSQTDEAVIARFTNRPDMKPAVEGFVRVPVFSGFVAAREASNETCKLTFQCEVALGGNLPEAVVDFQMKKFAAESLRTFSKEFQQPLVRETGN